MRPMSGLSRMLLEEPIRGLRGAAAPVVAAVNRLEEELKTLPDEAIRARLAEARAKVQGGAVADTELALVFALVREAARRTLNQRHFDVQLMGGLALAQGKIAEMRTGEGKTLVATLPATFHALAGKGVQIVTVNDYLARRDGAWMGQIYHFLGLTVGIVTSTGCYRYDPAHTPKEEDAERDQEGSFRVFYDYLRPVTKAEAYAADITYVTNNELGFDYLRDNTAYDAGADSAARPPLCRHRRGRFHPHRRGAHAAHHGSGPSGDSENLYERFAQIVTGLNPDEDYTVDEKQEGGADNRRGHEEGRSRARPRESLYRGRHEVRAPSRDGRAREGALP